MRNEKVGFVFQFHYLLKEFTAAGEHRAADVQARPVVARRGDGTGGQSCSISSAWPTRRKRRANRLSGGEQQRVAIARALANEPAVLLADEPTGNLDRKNSEVVADIFQQLAAGGQTIVMVTHDQSLAHRRGESSRWRTATSWRDRARCGTPDKRVVGLRV